MSGCPVKSSDPNGEKLTCPVSSHDIPNIIGDLPTGQERQPNQKVDLSVRRAVSNIEKVMIM